MFNPDFEYHFRHSVTAQWLLDVEPIYSFLQQQSIHSTEQLDVWLQSDPAIFNALRQRIVVTDANQAALDIYQLPTVAAFADVLLRFASENEIRHLCNALLNVSDDNHRYSYQTEVIDEDGPHILLITCTLPSVDEFFRGVKISLTDITAISQAEREAMEREKFLGAALRAVPDILMVYDFIRQATVFQNTDLIAQLGYGEEDQEETDNRLLQYIVHPDDSISTQALREIYQELVDDGIFEVTIRLQHANGDWRHYYFRSAAMERDSNNRLLNAVVVARDITEVLKSRQILSDQQRRYQLLADNFTDVIIITDTDLRITYISPSLAHCLGYDVDTFVLHDQPLTLLGFDERAIADLRKGLDDAPARIDASILDQESVFELDAVTAGGQLLPVEATVSILRDEYGLLEGQLMILRDITERLARDAEHQLAAKVFSNSLEGIYITNAQGVITQANQAFYRITGFTEERVIGKKPSQLSSGWRDKNFRGDIEPVLRSTGNWSGELMSRRANGEAFLIWMSLSEVRDSRDHLVGIITSFRDITEAKSSEENIRKLAYYDPLTELPNRQLLADRLSQALQRANRGRDYVALLFLDLDGFKDVNDKHGHAVGDILLTEVASRLKTCIRGDDTVARMGGDEFTIILGALNNKEAAEKAAAQVAKKVIHSLNETFHIEDNAIRIGTSIGIALYPDDANQDEALVKMADTAMYHAKTSGKNDYQFYTEDMHQRTLRRLQDERDIMQALGNNEFSLVYQPKWQLSDNSVCGFEALLRWNHPKLGELGPSQFIRIIDEIGLGQKMGQWVIDQALMQLQQQASLNLSVNVFGKHYRDGALAHYVESALERYGVEASRLTLEISEHLIMADTGYAYALITDLRALGVKIALDNFASGMLSVPYLSRLPVDEVKIDRQFIDYIDKAQQQLQLVGSLIALAQGLGFIVVAEGVERDTQRQLLEEHACERVQGYLLGRPFSADDLAAYLNHR